MAHCGKAKCGCKGKGKAGVKRSKTMNLKANYRPTGKKRGR